MSVCVLYVPPPQFTQAVPLLFSPGTHSFTQVPPFGPLQPVLQLQSVAASLPAALLLLDGHDPEQVVAVSVPVLYVPAPQFTQAAPLFFSPGPQVGVAPAPMNAPVQVTPTSSLCEQSLLPQPRKLQSCS